MGDNYARFNNLSAQMTIARLRPWIPISRLDHMHVAWSWPAGRWARAVYSREHVRRSVVEGGGARWPQLASSACQGLSDYLDMYVSRPWLQLSAASAASATVQLRSLAACPGDGVAGILGGGALASEQRRSRSRHTRALTLAISDAVVPRAFWRPRKHSWYVTWACPITFYCSPSDSSLASHTLSLYRVVWRFLNVGQT